ncbi:MAG: hypothetical protein GX167_09410 [Firmicutes bacterium]|nr:hypothetical protein [Bacillota bacterium]
MKKADLHRQKDLKRAADPWFAGIVLGTVGSVLSLRMLAASRSLAWLLTVIFSVIVLWLGFDHFYRLLAAAGGKQSATKQKSRRK